MVMLCMQTIRHVHRTVLEGRHAAEPSRQESGAVRSISRWWRTLPIGWRRRCTVKQRALWFEVVNRTASAHFIGGMPIAESADKGVVDPYQRAFGYPGLHVMDGSVMPANPGVNPSLMITGLAERAMSLWPNKGDADPRPPLGSGYNRLKPIMPHKPIVPKGAPAELRLNARKEDVIPLYPY